MRAAGVLSETRSTVVVAAPTEVFAGTSPRGGGTGSNVQGEEIGLAFVLAVMMPLALVNVLVVLFVRHFELPLWISPLATLASLIAVAAGAVGLPRPPGRANITYQGHPVTGKIVINQ